MLAVWSWLQELVEFDREISAEEGAKALTAAGLEVEEFRRVGSDFSGVVIAEVVSKEKHPDADKLTIVNVIDSKGGQPTVVICGAPNVPEPGGRVLWARPGAILPGGFEIGSKKLKGVMSAGMLCAEDELGLGDDHDGIVVLQDAAELELGAEAKDALGLSDVVFDLCIPANRADALGHVGIARELAALLGGKAKMPDTDLSSVVDSSKTASDLVKVALADGVGCKRYVAKVVSGLQVKPSPMWMQQRLRNVGVRPISNLVDVTNYVMYELGQPLHAFDYERLKGAKVSVRYAKDGEKMCTLDDVERELVETDLLICDAEAPVALAGVMGGQSSEVSDQTTTVLLESANFDPLSIRRTARRLGLHSDSSHRFERAVDPNGADVAANRAALLLAQVGGGQVAQGAVDNYPVTIEAQTVVMRLSRCAALSGISVARETVVETLGRQGLPVKDSGVGDTIEVTVPTSRSDITREVDLIEEVVRVYGFDKVPATLPATTVRPTSVPDPRRVGVHRAMFNTGLCEHISYGFTSPARIAALGLPDSDVRTKTIAIDNPMTVEQSVMRTSLWPNLLAAVSHNLKHDVQDVRLYEVGHVFLQGKSELPEEPLEICGVLAGTRAGWLSDGPPVDFYDAKGAVISILETIYGTSEGFDLKADSAPKFLHPGASARILDKKGQEIGVVGELHPRVRKAFDLDVSVFGFELKLSELEPPKDFQMTGLPRYPAITRDISFLMSLDIESAQVRGIIAKEEEALLSQVQVLEDYRDPAHVPVGKKGMLWSITYRSPDRTLTDAEVDKVHQRIEDRLLTELGATRR